MLVCVTVCVCVCVCVCVLGGYMLLLHKCLLSLMAALETLHTD